MVTFIFLDGSPVLGVENRLVRTKEDATVNISSLRDKEPPGLSVPHSHTSK